MFTAMLVDGDSTPPPIGTVPFGQRALPPDSSPAAAGKDFVTGRNQF
jgi:hypothetical protein